MDQTVLVKNKNQENSQVSEVNLQENVSDEDQPKKRTWTPAREEAWQKCLEGRKRYIETKKEIIEREQEEKSIKEKIRLELLKKKIREEIQNEFEQQQTSTSQLPKNNADIESPKISKSETNDKNLSEAEVVIRKESKPTKKRVIIEENSDSSSSEEVIIRRKKKKPLKKRRYYSESESEDDSEKRKSKSKHSVQPNLPPPAHHFARFSFV
jgi:hypothetical protein